MDYEQTVAFLTKQWGTKTLNSFREEAKLEKIGTAFESLRGEGGQRLMVVMCLTAADQIAIIEKVMDLSEEAPPADWNSLTLAEMAIRTSKSQGLSYEDLFDASGKRISITLCATAPESMGILQRLFSFP